jgi:hypothetical protein
MKFSPNPQFHPAYSQFQQMIVVAHWDGSIEVFQVSLIQPQGYGQKATA